MLVGNVPFVSSWELLLVDFGVVLAIMCSGRDVAALDARQCDDELIVAQEMIVANVARGRFVSGIAVAVVCLLFALLLAFVVVVVHALMLMAPSLPHLL